MENYENNQLNNNEYPANGNAAPMQNEQAAASSQPAESGNIETPVITIGEPAAAPQQTEPAVAAPAASDYSAPQTQPPYQAPPYQAPQYQPMQAQPVYARQTPQYTPAPAPQKIEYTPVVRDTAKRSNTGLKIFCAVLAAVICLTGACTVGYLFGRNSLSASGGSHSEVQLAAKPDKADEMTEAQVYEKLNESIVGIRVYNEAGKTSDCSGVVYSDEGYIISNDHIYSEIPNAKFKIYAYDGKEYDAVYIAGDQISDLTVLKVSGAKLKPAVFGESDDLFCGEHVVAIGRPNNAKTASSITSGLVSLPKRRVQSTTNYSSNLIQTDSAINPGSSGGALANMFGQVVGVTSSKLAGVQYDSMCFAIPSRTVVRVAEDLIKEGKVVSRAKLGITYTEIDSVTAEVKGTSATGLYIASVSSESDLYGKVSEGDIITHVNGIEVTSDTVVLDIIENSRAGDTVTVTVLSQNGTSADYQAVLLANEGSSSYTTGVPLEPEEDAANENGTGDVPDESIFNFPFGN